MMADRRFNAHPALGTSPGAAVQIVRDYDGRIFAMSSGEAKDLASQLVKAADQADERRDPGRRERTIAAEKRAIEGRYPA